MQFQHSIKKNKLKRRREIKKMYIKRWSEYVIKSIDMNLCICKNKKNYYLIMYASDLMIYELRCIYAITRVYMFQRFVYSIQTVGIYMFLFILQQQTFFVELQQDSNCLLLSVYQISHVSNEFLFDANLLFFIFFTDVMCCLSIYTYKRNI